MVSLCGVVPASGQLTLLFLQAVNPKTSMAAQKTIVFFMTIFLWIDCTCSMSFLILTIFQLAKILKFFAKVITHSNASQEIPASFQLRHHIPGSFAQSTS